MKLKFFFTLIVILLMTLIPMFAETVSPVDPGLSMVVGFNTVPVVKSTVTVQAATIIYLKSVIIKVLQMIVPRVVTFLIMMTLVAGSWLIIPSLRLSVRLRKKRGVLAFAGYSQ